MAIGVFVLDFFFGPCLDPTSSVDPRQNQPQHQQYYEHPYPQDQPPSLPRSSSSSTYYSGSYNSHRSPSERSPLKQLTYPPTIPEAQEQLLLLENGDATAGNNNNSERPRRNSINNGSSRGSSRSNSVRDSGTTKKSVGRHLQQHHPKKYSHRSRGGDSGISSLSDSFGGSSGKRRYRRDDASVISASLAETYKGYMAEDEDHGAEQKDKRKSKNNKYYQSSNGTSSRRRNSTSDKSELESFMERKNRKEELKEKPVDDYDNVTTISKASKNPYGVLGISQSASPRELYGSYKRRLREAERAGGSDRAFSDVGNAYRRIKADMKRQESRRLRRRVSAQQKMQESGVNGGIIGNGGSGGGSGSAGGGKNKKRGSTNNNKQRRRSSSCSSEESDAKSRRENIDARLKDHSDLVRGLFAKDNRTEKDNRNRKANNKSSSSSVSSKGQVTTLINSIQSQSQALSELNIVPVEAGANNINEQNQTICNSCFYLSLAASYLSGVGAFAEDPTKAYYLNTLNTATSSGGSVATVELEIALLPHNEKQLTMNLALQLKRAIEAAVLLVHPDWAESGMVGESVQAFSDFLVYALDSDSVLGHWAIAVFDEASGFVDVYRGRHYGKVYPPTKVKTRKSSKGRRESSDATSTRVKWKYKVCDEETRRANTLTLRYIPGHYQPLLPELTKMKHSMRSRREDNVNPRTSLEHILATLEKWNVLHVVTDGRA